MPYLYDQAIAYFEIITFVLSFLIFMVIVILSFILMAAFLTLYERQTLAAIQRRKGPNVVGFMGLLQAFADAFKLLFKEQSAPISSARIFFIGSSLYVVLFSLFVWAVIPLGYGAIMVDLSDVAFLYLISISSISVYGIIVAGWSSNSRYPFLGALRACAQMLAYELVISVILLQIFLFVGSLNITEVVLAQHETFDI
jgi:NADH:ubiquinone oxidoreductase subunit H